MRIPELAADLVRAAKEGVSAKVAVTVKMRSGWDETSINAPEFAGEMVAAGAQMVTVHGRTRQQRYSGQADWQIIRRVKESVDVPVVANGDIVDADSMRRALAVSGADGVMVGRAATGNPWVFASLASCWNDHQLTTPPDDQERIGMLLKHMDLYLKVADERQAVIEMRKFAHAYLSCVEGGDIIRQQINRLERAAEVRKLLADGALVTSL